MKKILTLSALMLVSIFSLPAHADEYNHTEVKVDTSTVPMSVSVGDTGQILPDQNGNYKSFRNAFAYKVSDSRILTIESDGRWKALQNGNVSIEIIPLNIDTATPAFRDELKKFGYEFPSLTYDIQPSQTFNVVVADSIPVFRLYNSLTLEHLYTVDANERDVLSRLSDWTYEGVAWNSSDTYGTPVYRLYNHSIGRHHYTSDTNEIDVLVERGWVNEGVAYYSSGSVPVYRLYLDTIRTHLLTVDKNEVDVLSKSSWQYEGVGLYAK